MTPQDTFKLAMIIDDSETDILISIAMAKRARFAESYITHISAKGALTYLWECKDQPDLLPDVIFLDINMPVMNGFAFLDEFDNCPQAVKEKCRIVMLSSSLDPNDFRKATDSPYVVEFISKPLHMLGLHELKENLVLRAACAWDRR